MTLHLVIEVLFAGWIVGFLCGMSVRPDWRVMLAKFAFTLSVVLLIWTVVTYLGTTG